MPKDKGQKGKQELKHYGDDLSYEAFKEHCENVPAVMEVMSQLLESLPDVWHYPAWRFNNRFDFERVKDWLRQIPDAREKLKFLYEIKTEFEQSRPSIESFSNIRSDIKLHFARNCDLEIEKIERLAALEQEEGRLQNSGSKERRDSDKSGTRYQNLLAIHYLLLYAKASCHNTKKAAFASFLTGYSENTFRQQWSNIHQKDERNKTWESDMRTVRDHFAALGLTEVVALIDNDLNSD